MGSVSLTGPTYPAASFTSRVPRRILHFTSYPRRILHFTKHPRRILHFTKYPRRIFHFTSYPRRILHFRCTGRGANAPRWDAGLLLVHVAFAEGREGREHEGDLGGTGDAEGRLGGAGSALDAEVVEGQSSDPEDRIPDDED